MSLAESLQRFSHVAANPDEQFRHYLKEGKKVVLAAPVYTPEEIVHAMGFVPMGAWGGDLPLERAKEYFPAFLCSIVQSILELGMKGAYQGASALLIPSLCDSLKCLGQNWKYGVPDIPFIPMTYPQNRFGEIGAAFTRAGYERVARDLEKAGGLPLTDGALQKSIDLYQEHNALMRQADEELARHPEISASQRSDIFKSAWFMAKEEHSEALKGFLACLKDSPAGVPKTRVFTTGILCSQPDFLSIFDELELHIVGDDVAAESRQYRVDTPLGDDPLSALAAKFERMDYCSVLYDPKKKRPGFIVDRARERGAAGVVMALAKFCDPEEFDYPLIKQACDAAGLPIALVEVDRQMNNFEQARTALETFRDLLA